METKNIISRRNFLTNTAAVASSFFIVPRHVLGKGFVAPSDKLNIAAIGCGGKAKLRATNHGIPTGESYIVDHVGGIDAEIDTKPFRGTEAPA